MGSSRCVAHGFHLPASLRSRPLPGFHATMGALTPARRLFGSLEHEHRLLSPRSPCFTHTPLDPIPSPTTTPRPRRRFRHATPQLDWAGPSRVWASPFAQQARRRRQAESRSSSYGPVVHLPLLPTPPRGDAVTFGYRPESVCLKRTCTSLNDVRSQARRPRRPAQPAACDQNETRKTQTDQ